MWNVKGVIEPFGCVCAMRRTAGVDCARSGCRLDGRPVRRWFEGGVSTVMCRSRLSGTAGGIEEIVAVRCVVDALFDKYSFSDAALQGSRPKRGERFRFSCCPTSVSGLTAGFGCRVVPYRFEQSQIVSGSFRLLGSVPSFFKLFCTASGCLGMFRAAWGCFELREPACAVSGNFLKNRIFVNSVRSFPRLDEGSCESLWKTTLSVIFAGGKCCCRSCWGSASWPG